MKRNLQNKVIGGVCSGLADHFGLDPVVIRLIFVLGFIFWGIGPIIYLIMWLLMPKE